MLKGYFCGGCGKVNPNAPQRYCPKCHAKAQRAWRKKQSKKLKELKAEVRGLHKTIRLLLMGKD